MDVQVKQELIDTENPPVTKRNNDGVSNPVPVIDLSSSESDGSDDSDGDDDDVLGENGKRFRVSSDGDGGVLKRQKLAELGVIVPLGFLDPLPPEELESVPQRPLPPPVVSQRHSTVNKNTNASTNVVVQSCKQFWKAGDYEGAPCGAWNSQSVGLDHVRVHPKFLHSNATSHKWALGAFAELLDNSLDEICYGATYVNIDMLESKKDGSRMLLIEDNGGGMDPDKVRQCMSLGYSVKSKLANTIGQYGNGFKTSTMRLGADVIVFSRCCGKDGKSPTQSIGLLSYTFLRSTGKEDIVVPMLDYERGGREWKKIIRTSLGDWNTNVETIVHWSPFSSEVDLLRQFNLMKDHGTRIIIYNLWEDDQGLLELDFDADKHDIQIRGVNRDEKNIQMAQQFPNSRHFLTYRHSLRSYASILYLRLPPGFRIILRGKDVEQHNIVNDMMLTQEVTYKPQPGADGIPKDLNMVAVVTIGFVKDAKHHIDVQGFNVYHKNRLIKPFWRLWNAAGSDGRGVIGVLEANFVEPAHDKQGFERTTVLSRLESRLVQMQKTYWSSYCDKIGYAPRRNKKPNDMSVIRETSPDYLPQTSSQPKKKYTASSSRTPNSNSDKFYSQSNQKYGGRESEKSYKTKDSEYGNGHLSSKNGSRKKAPTKSGKRSSSPGPSSHSEQNDSDDDVQIAAPEKRENGSHHKTLTAKKSSLKDSSHTTRSSLFVENSEAQQDCGSGGRIVQTNTTSQLKENGVNGNEHSPSNSNAYAIDQLKEENRELRERLKKKEDEILRDLLHDLHSERERCKSLETQLQEALQKIEDMNKEQESLIDIFSEERDRRDIEEENLRKKLKEASNTIQELLDKVRLLEKMKSSNSRPDR